MIVFIVNIKIKNIQKNLKNLNLERPKKKFDYKSKYSKQLIVKIIIFFLIFIYSNNKFLYKNEIL